MDLAKESADRYYRIEATERELKRALEVTRDEPGLSLADVAKVLQKVYEPEEIGRLISFLHWKDLASGRNYNKK